jgi:hypothetical protein
MNRALYAEESSRRPRLAFGPTLTLLLLAAASSACVIVPQNRRRYLADPTMQTVEEPLEARAREKLHTAREAAAGGNGQPAGGGCGCSN